MGASVGTRRAHALAHARHDVRTTDVRAARDAVYALRMGLAFTVIARDRGAVVGAARRAQVPRAVV